MIQPTATTPTDAPVYTPAAASNRPDTETCPTCGGAIEATFCARCGERRASARIYSLKEFAHEAFEVVTNVERSFLRTLWMLVRRPGELTAAYMRGERVRYLRPLQFFLLVNVVYFFIAGPAVTVYSTRLYNHLNASPYRHQAQQLVRDRRVQTGMTEEEYGRAFNEKSVVLARTLVVVLAPAFALVVSLMSVTRRKPAIQHLVFSLHFITYLLMLTVVVVYLRLALVPVWEAIASPLSVFLKDQLMGVGVSVGVVAYLVPAFQRAYSDKKAGAVLKAALGVAAVVMLLVGYRMLLFYATAYAL